MLDSNAKAEKISRSEYVRFKINTATMLPALNIDYNKFVKITAGLLEETIAIDENTKHSKTIDLPLLKRTLSEINIINSVNKFVNYY